MVNRKISYAGSLHYQDDFHFISYPDSPYCLGALNKFRDITTLFGIPLAEEKSVLPCTCLEFIGITIDTSMMDFRHPEEKKVKTKLLLEKMLLSSKMTLKNFNPF